MLVFPDSYYSCDLRKWELQAQTYDKAVQYFKGRRLAIDAGAFVGMWTTKMAADFNLVYAFEPALQNFVILQRNCTGLRNVIAWNCAVSDSSNELKLGFSATNYATVRAKLSFSVKAISLDEINLPFCDFIKIDVDGHDMRVLHGAKDLIDKHRPVLCVETKDDKTLAPYLTSIGYRRVIESKPDEVWIHD